MINFINIFQTSCHLQVKNSNIKISKAQKVIVIIIIDSSSSSTNGKSEKIQWWGPKDHGKASKTQRHKEDPTTAKHPTRRLGTRQACEVTSHAQAGGVALERRCEIAVRSRVFSRFTLRAT